MKYNKVPAIIVTFFLLVSFFSWPYGFYNLLRIIVAGSAAYYAYILYAKKDVGLWFWLFLAIVILFNPIAPIYLYDKDVWVVIDVLASIVFVIFILKNKN